MQATVISFEAERNRRRAAAETADRDAAANNSRTAKRADTLKPFEPVPLLHHLMGALYDATEHTKDQAATAGPMPAYCDPNNEWRGTKHDATEQLTLTEIAKRIRTDIKEAIKAGRLPKGLQVSITTNRYTGGGSINARITALPENMPVYASWYLQERRDDPHSRPWREGESIYSDPLTHIMDTVKELHGAYNRDNSDSMTDYFDRRYYGHVGLDWQLERAATAAAQSAD